MSNTFVQILRELKKYCNSFDIGNSSMKLEALNIIYVLEKLMVVLNLIIYLSGRYL